MTPMLMEPPLPATGEGWALFLDLDGTLAELAPHPDQVRVSRQRVALLSRIEERLDGALAVISGRSIESLDRLLAPLNPRAAGLHGMERRNGTALSQVATTGALDDASRELAQFVSRHPGLMLENKGAALALHFRNAPELEADCRERAAIAADSVAGHQVVAGKMVFEIKPRHTHKGSAIGAFLGEAPFRGRLPVFAGDDVTDEDGFQRVNSLDGISIKVGDGASSARFRLADVASLHAWLERLDARLARPGTETS